MSSVASRELARLGPIGQVRAGRLPRRLTQLLIGLCLYGVTLAMMIRSALGNAPWDVLHQGLARHLPLTIGQAVIVVSLLVLLLWIPLRELPGLGTIANSFLVGISADLTLSLLDRPTSWLRGSGCCSSAWCSTQWPPRSTSGRSSDRVRVTA